MLEGAAWLLQRRPLRRLGQGPEQPTMAAGAVDRPHGQWRLLPGRDHRGPGCGIIGVAGRCARFLRRCRQLHHQPRRGRDGARRADPRSTAQGRHADRLRPLGAGQHGLARWQHLACSAPALAGRTSSLLPSWAASAFGAAGRSSARLWASSARCRPRNLPNRIRRRYGRRSRFGRIRLSPGDQPRNPATVRAVRGSKRKEPPCSP